jgi:autotransporter passenger strand-loop-strand repeat protein
VGAGGEQIISGFGALYDLGSSARAVSATILSGGLQVVDGVASAAMLAGGEMIVSSGGVTDGAVVGSGGTLVVLSGGIDGGDPALNIGASIVEISIPTTVGSGGTEILMGTGTGDILDTGASMIVSSGGLANFATVRSGAVLTVSSGGQAGSTYFDAYLYGGAVVSSGGELVISSGGTELGASIAGVEIVTGGGTTSGDGIGSGGLEILQSGGVTQGVTISGGTLEVANGGVLSGAFLETGSLVLDASASFHGLVAGFGASDQIDLRDVGFVTATTKKGQQNYLSFTEAASNLSGTLTVNDGAHTANIQLLGQYTASEFTAASDGNGGTLITFTSATLTTGGHGHGNAIASPLTS